MDLHELLSHQEKLQDALDRRRRLLEDLIHVENEILGHLGSAQVNGIAAKGRPKALPPAGARSNGKARRAPKKNTPRANGTKKPRLTLQPRILAAMKTKSRSEHWGTGELTKKLNVGDNSQISRALYWLHRSGKVKRVAVGVYQLTSKGAA